jgi:hypothetical protein
MPIKDISSVALCQLMTLKHLQHVLAACSNDIESGLGCST